MISQPPARESPAPEPLQCGLSVPSHPDVGRNSPRPEPVLALGQIQGNVIPGFMKDFQTLIGLTIDHPEDFKEWLRSQIPFIATAAEVLAFNRLFKEIRARTKHRWVRGERRRGKNALRARTGSPRQNGKRPAAWMVRAARKIA